MLWKHQQQHDAKIKLIEKKNTHSWFILDVNYKILMDFALRALATYLSLCCSCLEFKQSAFYVFLLVYFCTEKLLTIVYTLEFILLKQIVYSAFREESMALPNGIKIVPEPRPNVTRTRLKFCSMLIFIFTYLNRTVMWYFCP